MSTTEFKNSLLESNWFVILLLATLKVLVHFATYDNYELHRDAYLYYAQSEHLAWGYVAVPPGIAVIGKLATSIFGNTTFGLRFFPAIVGAATMIILGLFVRDLGGRKRAILLAGFAYLLSPAYLHTNTLFQPVAFNHFFWLLSAYLFYKLIATQSTRYWLWIGLVFGLGFLNKYSIVFLYAALGAALLLTSHRKLLLSRNLLLGMAIGMVVISPNLFWQYENNWPVLQHMDELRRTQLVHVEPSGFLIDQIMMNAHALLLWLGALCILLFYKKERSYQFFGFSFLLLIAILLGGSGKSYYTLGIYPVLFAFGAYFVQKYIGKYLTAVVLLFVFFMGIGLYISLSFDGIPFLTFEQASREGAFRWEDGRQYDIPQDMADMTGWKEIGESVSAIYNELSNDCDIFCYHYGQAGAVMFYGKKHQLPQPISTNGSFVFWSPDSLEKNSMIFIHSDLGNTIDPDSLLAEFFDRVELKKVIENPYFRENGTRIYLCESPTREGKEFYINMMAEAKSRYRRIANANDEVE